MFCAKCGATLPDNAERCDECGALVRIRPDRPGRKKKNGKTRVSRSDEPVLHQEENAEKDLKEEKLMDPVFFEEAGEDVDVDAIIKIAHGEEPEKGDPELNMDSYLESLPLIEKIRRKIKAHHHKREEAIDEKRMQKQLERASKHFSEVETGDQKEKERRRQEELNRRREEKLQAEKAKAERAVQAARLQEEKAKAEKKESDADRHLQEKLIAEKAEAERAEAARLQEEAVRRQEEEKRAERVAAAARQKERARAGAGRRKDDQQEAQTAVSQENEGLEVIRLHGRDRAEEADVREEDAAEAALLQEAELAAEAARRLEEEEARKRAAQHEQSVRQQEERDRIQKILNTGSEEYDSFKPISEHNQKELSEAELRMEKLRRQRKYRNNQPDRFDEFLGKYGLTKETAVRIATLFLIVVLSVIYVIGRGSSKTTPDFSSAGEGMSGSGAVEEQTDDGTATEPSGDFEETQVPTGGGDFENN